MTHVQDDAFAAAVARQLDEIEQELLAVAVADSPYVTEAARHIISAGGKRFRPLLVALCANFGAAAELSRLVSAAIVVELTHAASLYHDDVMDEADLRRGVESANARYGNTVAILVGDYLFARASARVATLGVEYVRLQADTFARLVQGQIAETLGPEPGADPIEHYLSVVTDKTASLISTSCVFGGMIGGASDEALAALAAYGEELGVVFQLSDDLIDVTSDATGKVAGTDLREGVATLPTLLLRDSSVESDRALLDLIDNGLQTEQDVRAALAQLRANPVIGRARAEISRRSEIARSHLAVLPEGPAKAALDQLCDQVVLRSA